MKKAFKILTGAIILFIFAGTIVYLYRKSQAKPVVFETSVATVTNIIKKTVATGKIVPRKEIEIKPRISGIIAEIYVEAGDKVKVGDMIAKIRIIPNMINLNEAESRLDRARISLEDASMNYDRQKTLFEGKAIAAAELQNYEVALKNARQDVITAENNLQLIREGITRSAGSASNTIIRSTIAGMVLTVPVEVGNSVIESNTFNDGTTIATVADMGEMIFKGKVDESEVGKLHEGMGLNLTVGAIDTENFSARLEHISPKGVEENGAIQFEIRAAVSLKDSVFIRAGYSANADIVLERRDSVLAVQESLVKYEGDSAFVEIETAPQTFEKRCIKTGLSDGINVEVLQGLSKKDKIKLQNSGNRTI
ncbi:MAG: efflux RND transporter periplasmic adaptor subunit [Lentimicrobium sp.]|jgi:HlyD family secretion protein|nr:efflux RND transporter periplasmic adaptor subunit [Lentimicrobium sp.]MDD2528629.1 efflux RND transporter periplasmic adaptor subunit [Lentimicrobiaceae bacterium]MDD4597762.1 efflux RND transporter periplasmic adaptor subunit [Lentimicrobiaceae bacterium]MDY0025856.1 efflux RND transporter periplasmic adaptor subunit [Lentimicrobium sp.]